MLTGVSIRRRNGSMIVGRCNRKSAQYRRFRTGSRPGARRVRDQPIIATASQNLRHPGSAVGHLDARCGRLWSGNRDEDDHAIFGPDCSGDVTLAGEVFRQFDAAGSDLDRLSSGQHKFCAAAQGDHILAA
jgi:hypothetical protein